LCQRIVDGLNQFMRSIDVFQKDLAVRLQRSCLVEFASTQQPLNFLQFETQFPKKKNLLKDQELLFLVEAVTVRALVSGLEQSNLVVEMQRSHRDPGKARQLFN
jgi:hypothetical protein